MSILSAVTAGKQIGPQIHTIAGVNGVGKTTWAASFPKVLLVDLEKGSGHISVTRLTPENIPDLTALRNLLKELIETKHDYQTLVIDSAESLEGLICDSVCKDGSVTSIELYEGGYGKGWTRTREIMREIMMDLQKLQTKGITSIIVAHTQVKNITDPTTNQAYDRVIMRCNDKMAAIIRDLSDNVFYASYKVFTTKEKGKTKAFGDGQRVMYTQWRPGFDAKNRLELPLEVPLSFDAFTEACAAKPEADMDEIVSDIKAMAEKADDMLKKQVNEMLAKYKGNPDKLKEVKNRLMRAVAA